MRGFLRTCPSNIIIRFLFARCQAPSLSGRITLADDLLFRCLAHRARTALRPSSLLCSGVSLENRTFTPLRPPSLPGTGAAHLRGTGANLRAYPILREQPNLGSSE